MAVGLVQQGRQVQVSWFRKGDRVWMAGAKGRQIEVHLWGKLGISAASEALGFPLIIICRWLGDQVRLLPDR